MITGHNPDLRLIMKTSMMMKAMVSMMLDVGVLCGFLVGFHFKVLRGEPSSKSLHQPICLSKSSRPDLTPPCTP